MKPSRRLNHPQILYLVGFVLTLALGLTLFQVHSLSEHRTYSRSGALAYVRWKSPMLGLIGLGWFEVRVASSDGRIVQVAFSGHATLDGEGDHPLLLMWISDDLLVVENRGTSYDYQLFNPRDATMRRVEFQSYGSNLATEYPRRSASADKSIIHELLYSLPEHSQLPKHRCVPPRG